MELQHAAALALVGWYLMLPPWIAQNRFDANAPLSKWQISGRFDTAQDCKFVREAAVDWYIDHPNEKDASWFKRLYGAGRWVSTDNKKEEIPIPHPPT
ncbi:MAG: hypothetical protein ACLQU2_26710 [Candidatus Binataceae bacterium]